MTNTTNKTQCAATDSMFNAESVSRLSKRKQEIVEMARLMADEDNPSDREIALLLEPAKQVVDGIAQTMKWITGEAPRPARDPNWLQKLKEEVERGDFEYDEED